MSRKSKKIKRPAEPEIVPAVPVSPETWHVRIVIGLCALGFLVYANTFTSTFHFDDFAVIINNPAVRNLWDISGLFNAFNTRLIPGWTFALNYAVGQLNVVGYHFFNIWLHVCNAVLLYAFVHQLLVLDGSSQKRNPNQTLCIALAAALIFLVHPLATQPVNYIWQRTTLLVTFFYLGTLVLYVQYRLSQSKGFYWGALLACLLAMLSKETVFLLPVMIVFIELLFFKITSKEKRIWLLPFVLMMFIIPILLQRASGLTLELMHPHSLTEGVSAEVMSRKDYWMTQVNALCSYLRLFIVPWGQNVDHDYPLASQTGWMVWGASASVHLLLLSAAGYFLSRKKIISFSIVWFYLATLIESFVTSPDLLVEHRMYLPMAGLCVGVSTVLFDRLKNVKNAMIIVALVAIAFASLTVKRNVVWQDDLTLWTDAVAKSPMKARPLNNRGIIFKKTGHLNLALNDFDRAIALDPQYAQAYQNRGHLHKMNNNYDAALADYSKVLVLEPDNAEAYASRGNIYKRKEQLDQALADYSASIQFNPVNPEVYSLRAYVYQSKGDREKAIEDYGRAIAVEPHYVYAYNNRGNLYLNQNELSKAIEDYNQAIAIDPQFGEAYMNRAVAYFHLGKLIESKADVDRARQTGLVPNSEFVRKLKAAMKDKNIRMRP